MREQLAAAICERTGLDEAMALQVAEVALEFIKGKLPPALAPVVEGQSPDLSGSGALLGQLGGIENLLCRFECRLFEGESLLRTLQEFFGCLEPLDSVLEVRDARDAA